MDQPDDSLAGLIRKCLEKPGAIEWAELIRRLQPVLARIALGMRGTSELVVGPEHTAPFVGSGRIAVLATPVMINVIEAAALADEKVQSRIAGKTVVKIIVVPGKLVNLVVG